MDSAAWHLYAIVVGERKSMGLKLTSLILLFLIVLLLFGSGRLRSLGADLAAAIKSFRKGLQEEKCDPHDRD
jgi:sec-independent protein translocase protein TatA